MSDVGARGFNALIRRLGINPYVDVPGEVSRSFGRRGYIPVRGVLNGLPIRSTLVPSGKGEYRLYINGDMRRRAGVGVGDRVDLSLEFDVEPRIVQMPEALGTAFEKYEKAKAAWDRLTPSRRREILSYLNWLKTPEALQRNVGRVMAYLLKQEKREA